MNVLVHSRRARVGALTARIRAWLKTGRTFISLPWLAFLTIVVLLGVNFVAVRFSNLELPPFWGAGLRFVIASFALFIIVMVKRLPLPQGMGLVGATLFGVLVFGATYGFVYWALLHVSSGMAAVTFATIPLITTLLAVSLNLERLTWRSLFGAVLVLIGIGVVFQEQLQADVPLLSLVVLLLGALSGAFSGIVIKRFPKSHPISTNAVAMAVGAGLLIVTSRSLGESWHLPTLPVTWAALGWLIMSASVAFILMVWLLSKWSASATSYSTVLQPLVTVAVASWLAGEQVTLTFILGGAFALIGVYVGALTGQTEKDTIKKPVTSEGSSEASMT
ncbi:MAG: EamA family transporter [Anaerolineales bacterium]|nr:EamA family transporter [Anaerolineales bacterium]